VALVFETDFDPRYGELVEVSPLLRRIVARNPSKYTFHGTGTYVVGRGRVAVIDPGPDDADHLDALIASLRGETVSHILITHTHADHSPGHRRLAAETGAAVLGFGPHPPEAVGEGGGDSDDPTEGMDVDFVPDERLAHGDVVAGPDWTIEALHTPGHISNHLCFAVREERALLTGDHVMGWSTTVISPPDGNLADYLASLELVLRRDDEVLYPTHGGPRHDVRSYVTALYEHRLDREHQILEQLRGGPHRVEEIVEVLYADVRSELHKAAGRSVLAHLVKLQGEERVGAEADLWHLTSRSRTSRPR
jgi:glyoxylase-like metal-dependent hydrolase (beta-lactamase superfamily II)